MLNGFVNRLRLVGIELEGGWDTPPPGYVRDGSVKFAQERPVRASFEDMVMELRRDTQRRVVAPARRAVEAPVAVQMPVPAVKGEVVSNPLTVDQIEGWVRSVYPKYVNETCGLHVHMSFFHKLNYGRLMGGMAFTTWMVGKLRTWAEREGLPKDHPQWRRFDPDDPWTRQHCAHLYLGEAQARVTRKDYESRGKPYSRYTFVNYCHDMPGHDGPRATVEVRGLSMPDNPDTAIRAVMAVLDATNEFLSKIKQKERVERIRVQPKAVTEQVFRSIAA